ncbi:hypothetical protein Belba_0671 [Belliella baltica DSM 15883]|uniref:DUF4271 domain-containing protein n=1 Tax=Belliella baltica (strain DSM 15883 / CIP 108006 / LMG 21964 / BA134) TaxID=866536 RepID=I3Z258_BELBD|nr:DUF4271 domain-containing protein [Belliella baltica]AFL83326.1 hypothetical protein Belba_0671 [Belliella baltica DSM 15883]
MYRSQKQLILLLSLFFIQFQLIGQVVENYDSKLSYDKKAGWFQSSEFVQVSLDLSTFTSASFIANVPAESTVFMDNVLWFYTSNDTTVEISIKDLRSKFGFIEESKINFSVLKKDISTSEVSIKKGFFNKNSFFSKVSENQPLNQFEKRKIDRFYDFFFLALICILFFISIYKVIYPLVLGYILNPKSIFTAEDFSESNAIQKFFSLDIIFFIIINNLTVALIAMVGVKEIGLGGLGDFIKGDVDELFLYWLVITLGLFVLTIVKFLFIKFMTLIYELGKNEFAHFFYLLRVVSILMIFLVIIICVAALNSQEILGVVLNWSLIIFFWSYLLAVVLLMFIMMNRVSFNNYHLFAYICTAELVPFLIIAKVIMG